MIKQNEIFKIGHFNKTHGIKGEISATIDCDHELLKLLPCIIVDIDGIFVPFFINNIREKNNNTVLLTIDDVDNQEKATNLINKQIFADKKQFHKYNDELYPDEGNQLPIDFLIGFKANINKEIKGRVIDIDDSTANILFVVLTDDSKKTVLIPAVDEMIDDIDTENEIIEFQVPEALLDL